MSTDNHHAGQIKLLWSDGTEIGLAATRGAYRQVSAQWVNWRRGPAPRVSLTETTGSSVVVDLDGLRALSFEADEGR